RPARANLALRPARANLATFALLTFRSSRTGWKVDRLDGGRHRLTDARVQGLVEEAAHHPVDDITVDRTADGDRLRRAHLLDEGAQRRDLRTLLGQLLMQRREQSRIDVFTVLAVTAIASWCTIGTALAFGSSLPWFPAI